MGGRGLLAHASRSVKIISWAEGGANPVWEMAKNGANVPIVWAVYLSLYWQISVHWEQHWLDACRGCLECARFLGCYSFLGLADFLIGSGW